MAHLKILTILLNLYVGDVFTADTYNWIEQSRDYVNEGKKLEGTPLQVYENSFMVTQCAYRCHRNRQCKAYNYNPESYSCQLLATDHVTHPGDYIDDPGYQYYTKDAFVIDQEALGACGLLPCENGGACLDVPLSNGAMRYVCICQDGWTGQNCTIKEKGVDWGEWGDWGSCSVSCGAGWKSRHRPCVNLDTGATLSELECYGRAQEQMACDLQQCPYWGEWEEWGVCSSHTTCGSGVATRKRTCLHGGTPGVDRLCMGPVNETKPCTRPDCDTPVKLVGGSTFGEGLVHILTAEKGLHPVCGDSWDQNDAQVVCRQLGFLDGASEAFTGELQVNSSHMINHMTCAGDEESLVMCQHGGWQDNIPCTNTAAVKCIVNGGWSTWQAWGECSVTCAEGIRRRGRVCDYPPALRGGLDCEGIDEQTKACVEPPCPVNGEWEGWNAWTDCSTTCGGGMRSRDRVCHQPKYGGASCDTSIDDDYQDEACNEHECPIDGVWTTWSAWGMCSVTCGGGIRHRNRTCDGPKYGGAPCDEDNVDEDQEDCNTHSCGIDGVWAAWGEWAECSLTCGGGVQYRDRTCDGPKYGGVPCDEDNVDEDEQDCNTHPCPVDGEWSSWTEWGTCTVSCGGGSQSRERTCDSPAPEYGGADCVNQPEDAYIQDCNTHHCPLDAYWEEWAEWSTCDVSCGGGYRYRERDCVPGKYGGGTCEGNRNDTQNCGDTPCPVDGEWSEWTRWFECSVSCGGGMSTRYRTCGGSNYGGKDCDGESDETQSCNDHECPIDGVWEEWSVWGDCSVTCGGGIQYSTRECDGPFHEGAPCDGPEEKDQECNTHACPVDGVWSEWGDWGPCSVSCASGTKLRNRTCDGPLYGGSPCEGPDVDSDTCFTAECPVDGVWMEWEEWGACSLTCGGGIKSRSRECDGPYYGGLDCAGNFTSEDVCNTHPCPIDGIWEAWSDWSACSVSCGGGTKTRDRQCEGPFYGGQLCSGEESDTAECGTDPCPIDGIWRDWVEWSECSLTCGGGWRTRDRECEGPYYSGSPCDGDSSQGEDCNTHNCPVDGVWQEWSEWTECTVTCGGGSHTRERQCEGPFYGGALCDGSETDTGDCNTNPCPIPGEWMEWGEWAGCSTTCGIGQGTRTRIRDCDLTVHGNLTIDCIGENSRTEQCNDYDCLPKPITCGEMVDRGMINSDYINIHLAESSRDVSVFCDTNNGGTTEVRHSFMDRTFVRGYEGPGEFEKVIEYKDVNNNTISFQDVISIVDSSETCKQFIKWECFNAAISVTKGTNRYSLTWWVDRSDRDMYYWGGADPEANAETRDLLRDRINQCSCFLDGSCDDPEETCNCNKQDDEWHEDSGYVTAIADLPIKKFKAGDTGKLNEDPAAKEEEEKGYFSIGPLLCSGVRETGGGDIGGFWKKR